MKNLLKKGLSFGLGLAVMSKEQIEKTVDELVKKGEIAPEESRKVVNQMMERGEEERTKLNDMIKDQVNNLFDEFDTASREEVTELKEKVCELEKRVENLENRDEVNESDADQ